MKNKLIRLWQKGIIYIILSFVITFIEGFMLKDWLINLTFDSIKQISGIFIFTLFLVFGVNAVITGWLIEWINKKIKS